MRLVLPTPSSPTRQILNLKVFCSGSTDGFRIMVRAVPSQGVIKPAARFSVSGTDWLEPFDVGDRADPIAPRLEFRADGQADPRLGGRDEESMDQSAANSFERHEGPDLGTGERRTPSIQVSHRDRGDAALGRHVHEFAQLREAVLAKEPGRKDRKSTRLNSSHVSISYAV